LGYILGDFFTNSSSHPEWETERVNFLKLKKTLLRKRGNGAELERQTIFEQQIKVVDVSKLVNIER
jgi:hypothetical protein